MRKLATFGTAALVAGALATTWTAQAALAPAAPAYTVAAIGGPGAVANDINSAGVVVGSAIALGEIGSHAAAWVGGTEINLSGPPIPGEFNPASAEAVNDSNVAVGSDRSNVFPAIVPTVWEAWRESPLTGGATGPVDINDAGIVIGAFDPGGATAVGGWAKSSTGVYGPAFSLGQVNGQPTLATAINNHNVIVGSTGYDRLGSTAWQWVNGTFTTLRTSADARDVNDAGVVVGSYRFWDGILFRIHAAKWVNGTMVDLDHPLRLFSEANGINASGVIVGGFMHELEPGDPFANRGFVDTGTGLRDLNTLIPANSGWVLGPAVATNDRGLIVGQGTLNGSPRSYLLSPPTTRCAPPTGPISGPLYQLGVSLGVLGDGIRQLAVSLCKAGL